LSRTGWKTSEKRKAKTSAARAAQRLAAADHALLDGQFVTQLLWRSPPSAPSGDASPQGDDRWESIPGG